MCKTYENVKESFGMGKVTHFALVEKKVNIQNIKIAGSKGLSPLAGVGAAPRLNYYNMFNLSAVAPC